MWEFFVTKAYAYTIGVPISGDKKTYATFSEYLLDLIIKAVSIAGALAILMIIWGAFKYVTSAGDDTKAREGKDMITGALIGFGLLLLIRVILPLVQIQ